MVRNPGMVSFVIDIGDPAVLQIGSMIWIVQDYRRTREELVSIGHIAEDNAMEASNAADSFIRNYAGVSDHVLSFAGGLTLRLLAIWGGWKLPTFSYQQRWD